LPMSTSNRTGAVLDFRMRRVNFIAPPSLTDAVNPVVQTAIVDRAMDLAAKQCGELGDGTFNWLLRIDTTAQTLETGGARSPSDPSGVGYCFEAAAATTPPTSASAGYATAAPIPKLEVPIYLNAAGTAKLTLPLSSVVMSGVRVSADNDCIGSFNRAAL